MDPASNETPTRVRRLRRSGKLPQPSQEETDAIAKSEFSDGANATFFTAEQLDKIASGNLGKQPLGSVMGAIQGALKILKGKK